MSFNHSIFSKSDILPCIYQIEFLKNKLIKPGVMLFLTYEPMFIIIVMVIRPKLLRG